MTVEDVPALTPGLFGRLASGVAGGLAGGVVFGVMMQVTGMIPLVAQLIGRDSLIVGWAVHMSIAVFVATTHVLIFGLFAVSLPISTVLGVFYGLIWWFLGGLTLMPLRLGMGLFVFDTGAWQSLAGHLAYGLALGVVYAVVARMWMRGYEENEPPPVVEDFARPVLLDAPGQPRSVLPASQLYLPPPVPFGAGPPPPSPRARALRQHRRHER